MMIIIFRPPFCLPVASLLLIVTKAMALPLMESFDLHFINVLRVRKVLSSSARRPYRSSLRASVCVQ